MDSTDVKFALRLPATIHSEVKALAEAEYRSVNAQITALIHEALTSRKAREAQPDTRTNSRQTTQKVRQALNTPQQLSINEITGLDTDIALTQKQQELLSLLLHENLSYRELSRILGINASSVRDRTSTILRKLGLESRAELLDKAKSEMETKQP